MIEIHLPPREEVLRIGGVGPALVQLWPSFDALVLAIQKILNAT